MPNSNFNAALDEAQALANSSDESVLIFECEGGRYIIRQKSAAADNTHAFHVATINPHRDRGWGNTVPVI